MTNNTKSSPILINNPFTLLYWLLFRGKALRRYVGSIHEALDENLKVWEVRKEVADDPRFLALCRARWWLLTIAHITVALLLGGASILFDRTFNWAIGSLFALGHLGGAFINDALYWHFPQRASRWLTRFRWFVVLFGFGIPMLIAFLPVLESFNFGALLVASNPFVYILFLVLGVAMGVWDGLLGTR